jgi:hypothetical protein
VLVSVHIVAKKITRELTIVKEYIFGVNGFDENISKTQFLTKEFAQEILKLHGKELDIKSKEGEGSSFSFL